MIYLHEKGTNKPLGSISEVQLQFLVDHLEEEWTEDQDYAITSMLVDSFEGEGTDPELVSVLRKALEGRDEIEIAWSK
ncbi:MAG: galactosyldiacylglycerol synthase [Anaerolineales bacterium]|nr:galactosyldiacylglycerol synthase [Anaerolineales bacterium]